VHRCGPYQAEFPVRPAHSETNRTTQLHRTPGRARSQSVPDVQRCIAVAKARSSATWPWREHDHMTMDAIERRNLAEILKHDALHSSIDRDDMLSCHSSKKGDRRELSPADSLVCCATPEPSCTQPDHQMFPAIPGCVSQSQQIDEQQQTADLNSVDSVRKALGHSILRSPSRCQVEDALTDTEDVYKNTNLSPILEQYWVVWGILARSGSNISSGYRNLIGFLSLCCTGLGMYNLVLEPSKTFENFAETAFSVSCLVSLLCNRNLDCLIGHEENLLAQYAARHHFLEKWDRRGKISLIFFQIVWICKAAACVMYITFSETTNSLHAICTAFALLFQAGIYLSVMHCAFHITSFLHLMLNRWTADFNYRRDYIRGADSWNSVQALMRRVAEAMQSCFLAVQTAALVALLSCAARILHVIKDKKDADAKASSIWMLLVAGILMLAVCALAWFATASAVTEQSGRVPPVVNSLLVAHKNQISCEHQMFVSFIKNSETGFYVGGGRLNATVFMNYCYLCAAVICALFSTALNMYQQQ